MLLQDERGLPAETLLENLDFILRVLPSDFGSDQARNEIPDVLQSSDTARNEIPDVLQSSNTAPNDISDVLQSSDIASGNGANSLTAVEVNSEVETTANLERNESPGTTLSDEVGPK
jgi:hypothetical protein